MGKDCCSQRKNVPGEQLNLELEVNLWTVNQNIPLVSAFCDSVDAQTSQSLL
jgi:hypothetical protein